MERESTTTQIALLEALKASLFGTEPVYPEDTDWAEVVNEAKVQTVMGVISPVVPVTDEITNIGITNYSMLLYEQDKLVRLLDKNGIHFVILKALRRQSIIQSRISGRWAISIFWCRETGSMMLCLFWRRTGSSIVTERAMTENSVWIPGILAI